MAPFVPIRGNVLSPLNEMQSIRLTVSLRSVSESVDFYVFVLHCLFVCFYDNSISDCSVLYKLNCNDSVLYEKAMECEDQGADKFANDNDHDCR